MTIESKAPAPQRLYALQTRERIDRAVGNLSGIERAEPGSVHRAVRLVGEQQQACRRAGFPQVADLCRRVNDYLTGLPTDDRRSLSGATDCLGDVLEFVRLHADLAAAAPGRAGGRALSHGKDRPVKPGT